MINIIQALGLPTLTDDLARVESALNVAMAAEDPFLNEVAGHLITAGGKRLRPALTLAAAAAVTGMAPPSDDVVQGGTATELVHIGSLYHDDVMDEATSRRGVESVNHRWGNLVAILAGDYLLARASEIAASLGTEVAGLLAGTIARLCDGQVSELRTLFVIDRSEAAYFMSITEKTASLLSAACRIGAIVAGADRSEIDTLTDVGLKFGVVFQIADDVLDVVGTDEILGKPAGHDIEEGVYTLPFIRALATRDGGPELKALLGGPVTPEARDAARQIARASGGVDSAIATARGYADEVAAAAGRLPESPVRDRIAALGHAVLDALPL
ncbi:MAG TPA: polyprenyl synthetase family protein [Acidimicrobiales bacterium]|nr:polyprenyl synthetase family protein [Acidimicrobiales bacterium]